jgi:hypothetical protein
LVQALYQVSILTVCWFRILADPVLDWHYLDSLTRDEQSHRMTWLDKALPQYFGGMNMNQPDRCHQCRAD